ncbi:acyl-CoA desaturase [Nocardia brasiliensis]|uniref:Stearoyl-CoA 9-desaturase n=1 Tax=Nocardia brasiliensis (strain ATCC 700358 / HUJEG-1) TaxID=1133849 RepID=K0F2W4_NOCB7|nr:acyl-CoA desaturase [Nocardia brasiliensis]AFU03769.1 stearoyl-CoA 9-desaturase [Nocardia brasiliensis ATCC 700358]OCF89505.1 stearoyl-CoA 9-desaturase [Nocardia brasiliensis]
MNGREHYIYILAASILPFVGVIAAMVLLWNSLVGPADLAVFVIMSVIGGLGVSIGYHRLLAHRSFKTTRPIKLFFVTAGAMAGQGPPLIWVAHHRRHHRVADKPGDPHSPYFEDRVDFRGVVKGLWHSHLGWLFDKNLSSDPVRYCPDLCRDADIRFLSIRFVPVVLAGLLLPGLLGLAFTGTLAGFLTGILWGGLVRMFIGNHVTYAVNSIGHYFGRRRFDTADESRNVFWLSIPSFGESWHNNHHAFPRSARHGFRWWELDLSALTIYTLEKLHLAWDIIRIDPARQRQRAAGLSRVGSGRTAPHEPARPLAERGQASAKDLGPVDVADVE